MRKTTTPAWQNRPHLNYLVTRGLTLQQIGDMYGVSRERVRQVLKRLGIKSRVQRQREAQLYAESHNLTIHIPAGRNCNICGEYKFWSEFARSNNKSGHDYRCKACIAARKRHMYHNDGGIYKANQIKWQRENKERCAEYQRRWRNNLSDERRAEMNAGRAARARERYRNDPEFRDRQLKAQRRWRGKGGMA